MINLKIFRRLNKKAILSSLSAVAVGFTLCGCCTDNHHKKINEQNTQIEELNSQISNLKSEISALNNQNKQLTEDRNNLEKQISELTATPEPTVEPIINSNTAEKQKDNNTKVVYGAKVATDESIARSKQIQDSKDKVTEIYKVYDYVGDEIKSVNGHIYRWVSIPGDAGYSNGLLNMDTLTEDIPCKKYDSISSEIESVNGHIYRWVSIPGDAGYSNGLLNMDTLTEDIPCKKYDSISSEIESVNGHIYRWVSIPGDAGYSNGLLNMDTLTEDIPCKTYSEITNVGNDIYQCTRTDGSVYAYNLGLK